MAPSLCLKAEVKDAARAESAQGSRDHNVIIYQIRLH